MCGLSNVYFVKVGGASAATLAPPGWLLDDTPCRFEVLSHSLGKVAGFISRKDSACQ